MSIKVIGFDLFGTLVDLLGYSDKAERRAYGDCISNPVWHPFRWEPYWERMPEFPDSGEGIAKLQMEGFRVVCLSNAPFPLAMAIASHNGLCWDGIIPLETIRTYKPNPVTYQYAADLCQVNPSEFLMVSANKDFGDIENSRKVGCKSQLIRHPECPATVIELAEWLHAGKIGT
jgi:HAD superfamily hydrolase (TIGR01493 family)